MQHCTFPWCWTLARGCASQQMSTGMWMHRAEFAHFLQTCWLSSVLIGWDMLVCTPLNLRQTFHKDLIGFSPWQEHQKDGRQVCYLKGYALPPCNCQIKHSTQTQCTDSRQGNWAAFPYTNKLVNMKSNTEGFQQKYADLMRICLFFFERRWICMEVKHHLRDWSPGTHFPVFFFLQKLGN